MSSLLYKKSDTQVGMYQYKTGIVYFWRQESRRYKKAFIMNI